MSTAALLQSIVNGLASSGIYILVALGMTLVMSIMGIVQMSHGEIYMIGAYCVYYMVVSLGMNFFLALLIATIFVGCIGIIVERIFFRPFRADFDRAVIISIGLILVFQNVILSIAGGDPRSYNSPIKGVLRVFGTAISWERLFIVLTGLVLLVGLFLFIKKTKTGQAMLAVSQERDGAALQGIDIDRLSAIAMFLGCGLAAIAGALVGALFSMSPTMGTFALMKGIAVIVLGGLGSIPGAVIGGLIIGLIDGIVPVYTTSHIAGLIGFAAIILILIFRPQGIAGHE
ncbi:MAG: branched-chain amino acid ABC transporter permease [Deltaproteobacteria bacterium]|nr:branched-chain amino acid ABC transporter permease [Deltaproteobacteria bacterium]